MLLCARPGTPPRPSQRDRLSGTSDLRSNSVLTHARDDLRASAQRCSRRLVRTTCERLWTPARASWTTLASSATVASGVPIDQSRRPAVADIIGARRAFTVEMDLLDLDPLQACSRTSTTCALRTSSDRQRGCRFRFRNRLRGASVSRESVGVLECRQRRHCRTARSRRSQRTIFGRIDERQGHAFIVDRCASRLGPSADLGASDQGPIGPLGRQA
jgi:hypothetical protein